jgi:hypothetical protein
MKVAAIQNTPAKVAFACGVESQHIFGFEALPVVLTAI